MMRKLLGWIIVGGVALLMSVIAAAEPLTEAQVKNYIASFAETQTLAEQWPTPQTGIDRHRPLVSGVALLSKDSQFYLELSSITQKHHFRNAEHWADVGDRVMNAYLIVKEGATLESIERNYKEAAERINTNPDYTEQHKKGVLVGMEKGFLRNVKKIQDAQPDLPAVAGLLDEVTPLFAE